MAFLKQLLATLAVLLVGVALWMKFDARPGHAVLAAAPGLPNIVRSAVLAISPEAAKTGEAQKAEATPLPRGQGAGRPTIVIAGTVGTAETRNRLRVIGTGEAEHSVVVYPDNTGFIATIPLRSGDEVKAGSVLATLENDTEKLAVDRGRIALDAAEEKFQRYQRLVQSRAVASVEANDVARERDNARLDLQTAEIALAKRTVAAPLAGRVGIVNVEPGDLVSNQSVIATVDDRRRLRVIFYTPESFVQELEVGAAVEAVATARPEKTYNGVISAIDSRLDEASRTLRTEALLDNAADELRPGMSFALTLKLPGETLLAVDPLAVQWERDGAFVWKIVGDTVKKASVRIVERTIDRMLLTAANLIENDRVVVEGVQSVRDGGKVEVRGAPQPVPAAPAVDEPTAEGSASLRDAGGAEPPVLSQAQAAEARAARGVAAR